MLLPCIMLAKTELSVAHVKLADFCQCDVAHADAGMPSRWGCVHARASVYGISSGSLQLAGT